MTLLSELSAIRYDCSQKKCTRDAEATCVDVHTRFYPIVIVWLCDCCSKWYPADIHPPPHKSMTVISILLVALRVFSMAHATWFYVIQPSSHPFLQVQIALMAASVLVGGIVVSRFFSLV